MADLCLRLLVDTSDADRKVRAIYDLAKVASRCGCCGAPWEPRCSYCGRGEPAPAVLPEPSIGTRRLQ